MYHLNKAKTTLLNCSSVGFLVSLFGEEGFPQALGLFLWLVCWTDLFYSFWERNHHIVRAPVFLISPTILGITMVTACHVFDTVREDQRGPVLRSDAPFLADCIPVCSHHIQIQNDARLDAEVDVFRYTTFYIYFALVLIQFILSCFPERPPLFSENVRGPVSVITAIGGMSHTWVFK
ncbi:Multidrug resistance-associated protein 1, partial [Ophiophagus hannah]